MRFLFLIQKIGIITLLSVATIGCRNASLSQYAGEYSGEITITQDNQSLQQQIRVLSIADGSNHLILSGEAYSKFWQWEIRTQHKEDQIYFTTQGDVNFDGPLKKNGTDSCYKSLDLDSPSQATLCLNNTDAEIIVSDSFTTVRLEVLRPTGGMISSLEEPMNYTALELRSRAKNMSFSSRMEFEKTINAKLSTRLKYLNLLPHFSAGSILAVATYAGIPGLLSSIGDLAPFLLPSRWIDASESALLQIAQEFASKIMQLDTMQIIEGMTFISGRDHALHDQFKIDRALQTQILQEVNNVEQLGRIAPGSSLAISSVSNTLDQTISSLESQIALEMTDLAHAAGFVNPNAILSVTTEPNGNISQAPQFNLNNLQAITLRVSPELKQSDAMITAAQRDKEKRGFQWLDPAGDPSGGLGFGLPTYIEIGESNVRELLIARDELNSIVLRKITDAYNDYLGWIDSYKLALEGVQLQEKRIDYARKALQTTFAGSAVDELRDALEQIPIHHANLVTAEYAWYVALSRINRLLRINGYQEQINLYRII